MPLEQNYFFNSLSNSVWAILLFKVYFLLKRKRKIQCAPFISTLTLITVISFSGIFIFFPNIKKPQTVLCSQILASHSQISVDPISSINKPLTFPWEACSTISRSSQFYIRAWGIITCDQDHSFYIVPSTSNKRKSYLHLQRGKGQQSWFMQILTLQRGLGSSYLIPL